MRLQRRIALELIRPRKFAAGQWILWAACLPVIAFGFAVCVLSISQVLIVVIESLF